MVLIYISQMTSDIEHHFMGLLPFCIPCLVERLFMPFAHFLIELIIVLVLSLESSLYILV